MAIVKIEATLEIALNKDNKSTVARQIHRMLESVLRSDLLELNHDAKILHHNSSVSIPEN